MLGSCGGSWYLFWGVLRWGLALEIGQGACLKDELLFFFFFPFSSLPLGLCSLLN